MASIVGAKRFTVNPTDPVESQAIKTVSQRACLSRATSQKIGGSSGGSSFFLSVQSSASQRAMALAQ